jgi:hypothetical protein
MTLKLLSKKCVYFLTVVQFTIRLQVSRGIAGNVLQLGGRFNAAKPLL